MIFTVPEGSFTWRQAVCLLVVVGYLFFLWFVALPHFGWLGMLATVGCFFAVLYWSLVA